MQDLLFAGFIINGYFQIPTYFNKWIPYLKKWHIIVLKLISPKSVALTFSASQKLIDKVIVGVEMKFNY